MKGPAPNFSITASAPSSAASTYGLVLDAAVLPNGGATSYSPTIEAALPSGQSFASAPSPSGWNCAVSGAGQTLLTCTTASSSIAAGTVLTAIDATIVPAAVGLHTAQVTMSDSLDGAFEVSTSSTTDSPAADLVLGASPMTAQVSAGSSYTLSLSASTGSSGGEVFGNLVLDVNLPAGENFTVAPTATGWSCTVPGTNTASLSCTYSVSTASPVAPGTSLALVAAVVKTAGSATGALLASALLEDTGDGAATADVSPSMTVTTTPTFSLSTSGTPTGASAGSSYAVTFTSAIGNLGGDAYNEPSLSVTLPSGESFPSTAPTPAGWACSVSGPGNTTLGCTSTAGLPLSPGTPLGSVQATVAIAGSAHGLLTTDATVSDPGDAATAAAQTAAVNVTAPPGLSLIMSGTPAQAAANTSYAISLSPTLNSAGPAYNDPALAVDLPSGETFVSPAPAPSGWACALSSGNAVLSCTSTRSGTISAGAALGALAATVDIGAGARSSLATVARLSDSLDAATPTTAGQSVLVTATPVLVLSTSGTPAAATVENTYPLFVYPSLSSGGGVAYDDPTLSVDLPGGETFATPLPVETGWSCALSPGNADLSCTSTHSLTISAGTTLGTLMATVDIGPGASGIATTTESLADPGDGATPADQSPAVDITPPPVMALSTSGTPAGAAANTGYTLTISASLGSAGGPAYNAPTLVVILPGGESFSSSATSPTGWACALSAGKTILTCTSTAFPPIAAGSALGNVVMPVVIAPGARGSLTTNASLSDSPDGAATTSVTASVTVTAPPVLALTTSGTPTSAAPSSSYTLTLAPSLGTLGGAAYGGPTLSAALPSGESFQSPAPVPTGWACTYSAGNTRLDCTSTGAAPTAAGSSLGAVNVTVDIAAGATGTLTTTATLADNADAATPVTQLPAVGIVVTPPSPPSPAGAPARAVGPTTTTSSSTTSTSTTSTSTTSTSTTTTSAPTTTTTTGHGGGLAPGPLQTPVLPPVLKISVSAPASAKAGGAFTLKLAISLGSRAAPPSMTPLSVSTCRRIRPLPSRCPGRRAGHARCRRATPSWPVPGRAACRCTPAARWAPSAPVSSSRPMRRGG